MKDFALYSDRELKEFSKTGDISGLKDSELLHLKYELTQVPSRAILPVPLKLIKEIQSRDLQKPESRSLYGEYGIGK
tara:strand:+ start:488 stop:718 length:231 start_codon:yes stop_codon:yes gene_type:complete